MESKASNRGPDSSSSSSSSSSSPFAPLSVREPAESPVVGWTPIRVDESLSLLGSIKSALDAPTELLLSSTQLYDRTEKTRPVLAGNLTVQRQEEIAKKLPTVEELRKIITLAHTERLRSINIFPSVMSYDCASMVLAARIYCALGAILPRFVLLPDLMPREAFDFFKKNPEYAKEICSQLPHISHLSAWFPETLAVHCLTSGGGGGGGGVMVSNWVAVHLSLDFTNSCISAAHLAQFPNLRVLMLTSSSTKFPLTRLVGATRWPAQQPCGLEVVRLAAPYCEEKAAGDSDLAMQGLWFNCAAMEKLRVLDIQNCLAVDEKTFGEYKAPLLEVLTIKFAALSQADERTRIVMAALAAAPNLKVLVVRLANKGLAPTIPVVEKTTTTGQLQKDVDAKLLELAGGQSSSPPRTVKIEWACLLSVQIVPQVNNFMQQDVWRSKKECVELDRLAPVFSRMLREKLAPHTVHSVRRTLDVRPAAARRRAPARRASATRHGTSSRMGDAEFEAKKKEQTQLLDDEWKILRGVVENDIKAMPPPPPPLPPPTPPPPPPPPPHPPLPSLPIPHPLPPPSAPSPAKPAGKKQFDIRTSKPVVTAPAATAPAIIAPPPPNSLPATVPMDIVAPAPLPPPPPPPPPSLPPLPSAPSATLDALAALAQPSQDPSSATQDALVMLAQQSQQPPQGPVPMITEPPLLPVPSPAPVPMETEDARIDREKKEQEQAAAKARSDKQARKNAARAALPGYQLRIEKEKAAAAAALAAAIAKEEAKKAHVVVQSTSRTVTTYFNPKKLPGGRKAAVVVPTPPQKPHAAAAPPASVRPRSPPPPPPPRPPRPPQQRRPPPSVRSQQQKEQLEKTARQLEADLTTHLIGDLSTAPANVVDDTFKIGMDRWAVLPIMSKKILLIETEPPGDFGSDFYDEKSRVASWRKVSPVRPYDITMKDRLRAEFALASTRADEQMGIGYTSLMADELHWKFAAGTPLGERTTFSVRRVPAEVDEASTPTGPAAFAIKAISLSGMDAAINELQFDNESKVLHAHEHQWHIIDLVETSEVKHKDGVDKYICTWLLCSKDDETEFKERRFLREVKSPEEWVSLGRWIDNLAKAGVWLGAKIPRKLALSLFTSLWRLHHGHLDLDRGESVGGGFTHGDLHTSNVFLSGTTGHVRFLDFGRSIPTDKDDESREIAPSRERQRRWGNGRWLDYFTLYNYMRVIPRQKRALHRGKRQWFMDACAEEFLGLVKETDPPAYKHIVELQKTIGQNENLQYSGAIVKAAPYYRTGMFTESVAGRAPIPDGTRTSIDIETFLDHSEIYGFRVVAELQYRQAQRWDNIILDKFQEEVTAAFGDRQPLRLDLVTDNDPDTKANRAGRIPLLRPERKYTPEELRVIANQFGPVKSLDQETMAYRHRYIRLPLPPLVESVVPDGPDHIASLMQEAENLLLRAGSVDAPVGSVFDPAVYVFQPMEKGPLAVPVVDNVRKVEEQAGRVRPRPVLTYESFLFDGVLATDEQLFSIETWSEDKTGYLAAPQRELGHKLMRHAYDEYKDKTGGTRPTPGDLRLFCARTFEAMVELTPAVKEDAKNGIAQKPYSWKTVRTELGKWKAAVRSLNRLVGVPGTQQMIDTRVVSVNEARIASIFHRRPWNSSVPQGPASPRDPIVMVALLFSNGTAGLINLEVMRDLGRRVALCLHNMHARGVYHGALDLTKITWSPVSGEVSIINFGESFTREDLSENLSGKVAEAQEETDLERQRASAAIESDFLQVASAFCSAGSLCKAEEAGRAAAVGLLLHMHRSLHEVKLLFCTAMFAGPGGRIGRRRDLLRKLADERTISRMLLKRRVITEDSVRKMWLQLELRR